MPAPKNPKTSNMTHAERAECLALREEGWTLDAIAQKYGRHWKTISKAIVQLGGDGGRRLYHQDAGDVVAPEYNSWRGMKKRCYDKNNPDFSRYGGRGITVCDRWLNSYPNFLEDLGRKPTPAHTVERERNNEGYHPGNCVWATRSQQGRNTERSHRVTIGGKTTSVYDVADHPRRAIDRLNAGWCPEEAIAKPPRSIHGGR